MGENFWIKKDFGGNVMRRLSSNLTMSEVNAVARALVESAKSSGIVDENLDLACNKINDIAEVQTVAIKKDKTYSGLEAVDAKRDTLIRDINTILKAMAVIGIPETEAAASKLLVTFNKYGIDMANQKYDIESTLIDSLQKDFSSDEAVEAIKLVPGFKAKTEALWQTESEFKAKTAEYVKLEALKDKSAYALKKDLLLLVNDVFVPYVASMSYLKESFKPLYQEIDKRLERANSSVK